MSALTPAPGRWWTQTQPILATQVNLVMVPGEVSSLLELPDDDDDDRDLATGLMMEVPRPFKTPHNEVRKTFPGYMSPATPTPDTIFFILSTSFSDQSKEDTWVMFTSLYTAS